MNYTEDQLLEALRAADAAGDTAAARAIARRIDAARKAPAKVAPQGFSTNPSVIGARAATAVAGDPMGAARTFMQGATMGWADELMPFARAAYTGVWDPEGTTNEYRKSLSDFRNRNPAAAPTIEFAGGMIPAALTMGRSAPSTLSGAVGRSAAAGTGLGAVAGAGQADENDRMIGAGTGALIGGTLSAGLTAAAPTAANLTGRAVVAARNAARGGMPQQQVTNRAQEVLLRALERDQLTPEQVLERQIAAQRAGVPEMTLPALGGSNVQGRYGLIANTPGAGRETVERAARAQARGQAPGIMADVERAAGVARENTNDTAARLIAGRRAAAKPAYEAAYRTPDGQPRLVQDPKIGQFLSRQTFQQAAQRGARLYDITGEPMPPPNSVEFLDLVKRGLGDMIAESRRTGGAASETTRALSRAMDDFVSTVDEAVPEYAAARAQFAGDLEMERALEAGRSVLGASPDDWRQIAARIPKMTGPERELLATGLVDDIGLRLERQAQTTDGRAPDLTKLLSTQQVGERLRTIFPTEQSYDRFLAALQARQQLARVNQRALGGSPTAPRMNEAQDAGVLGEVVTGMTYQNPLVPLLQATNRAVQRGMAGINEQVGEELARAMTMSGPELTRYLGSMEATRRRLVEEELRRLGIYRGVGAAFGLGAASEAQGRQ